MIVRINIAIYSTKLTINIKLFDLLIAFRDSILNEYFFQYDLAFVGDLGGSLGLLLGASILSIIEVLDLLLLNFIACFKKSPVPTLDSKGKNMDANNIIV